MTIRMILICRLLSITNSQIDNRWSDNISSRFDSICNECIWISKYSSQCFYCCQKNIWKDSKKRYLFSGFHIDCLFCHTFIIDRRGTFANLLIHRSRVSLMSVPEGCSEDRWYVLFSRRYSNIIKVLSCSGGSKSLKVPSINIIRLCYKHNTVKLWNRCSREFSIFLLQYISILIYNKCIYINFPIWIAQLNSEDTVILIYSLHFQK